MKTTIVSALFVVANLAGAAHAETVIVEQRGPVYIDLFNCRDFLIAKNPIDRICYDISEGYLLVSINGRYLQYCEVDKQTFDDFLNAPTMTFYKTKIEGGGAGSPFDCRLHRLPDYGR